MEYPFLAYKSTSPSDNEIAIQHLAQYMPLKKIYLGNWKFLCFVRHTLNVENQVYGFDNENNCDIMMLLKKDNRVRLMSIKMNPWL